MALTTFVDVVNEVLNFGFNDGPQVNRARVQNWVNEAQTQIARQVEGSEFQSTETITLVPSTYSYALPSDFARMLDVQYPVLNTRLVWVDPQDYDMSNVTQVFGPPATYTLYQSNLLLFPNPTHADDIVLRYMKVPATLVNDSDVPELNSNYLHLLVRYAAIRAFEAEDDYEAAQYFQGVYEKQLDQYASDVQLREVDRPRQIDGTWSFGSVSRSPW